jgi:aldehyde dehydrogenase
MKPLDERLIRDVVADVLGRLGGTPVVAPAAPPKAAPPASPAPASGAACGCPPKPARSAAVSRGRFGVFTDAAEACAAAQEAYLQLKQKGVEARRKIEAVVKTLAEKNAESWGRLELDETKIGRLDHKIEKLQIIKLVPGVDWLRPDGRSGDHGITLEEYTPFGVVGARTRAPVVARPPPSALTTRPSSAKPASRTLPARSRSPRWNPSTPSATTRTSSCSW